MSAIDDRIARHKAETGLARRLLIPEAKDAALAAAKDRVVAEVRDRLAAYGVDVEDPVQREAAIGALCAALDHCDDERVQRGMVGVILVKGPAAVIGLAKGAPGTVLTYLIEVREARS